MSSLRVAHVTYAMNCGGVEHFIIRQSEFLKSHGCDIEIITTENKGEWFDQLAEKKLKSTNIPKSGYAMQYLHAIKVGRYLVSRNFDVIFLNHAAHAQVVLGMLPHNTIVIPILHSDSESWYRVGLANNSSWHIAVGVSPKLCSIAKNRVPGKPIRYIPHGVPLPAPDSLSHRQPPDGVLQSLYIGRLSHSDKGIFFLPEILKKCLDKNINIFLNIIGEGEDRKRLESLFNQYGLDSHVRFWGMVEPSMVNDFLLASHVLFLPSFYEGFGIILLEAQSCGCVPIASHLAGITDIAIKPDESGILIDVANTSAFAEAAALLYRDPKLWTRMSEAGYRRVKKLFSLEVMGQAYLDLISQAMAGNYRLPNPRGNKRLNFDPLSWRGFFPDNLKIFFRKMVNHFGCG